MLLLDQEFAEGELIGQSSVMKSGVTSIVYAINVDWLWLAFEKPVVAKNLAYVNSIRFIVQVSCIDQRGDSQFLLVSVDVSIVG